MQKMIIYQNQVKLGLIDAACRDCINTDKNDCMKDESDIDSES